MNNPREQAAHEAHEAFETYLDALGLGPGTRLRQDLIDRYERLSAEATSKANCDHEDVVAQPDPKTMERALGATVDPAKEGVQTVFHATCNGCGATLDAELSLSFNREVKTDE